MSTLDANIDTTDLPVGAGVFHLGPIDFSADLAERLAEAGASDAAVDAAGGPGTAERLRHLHAA